MGGSSSKEKRAKPQQSPKHKTKGKTKGKNKPKKGSVQWSRADGEGGDVTFIPAGRRRSSNDVEDLTSPPQRGRSKSLRFGDFTQLDRVQKVDTTDLLPIDIAFFQEGKVEPEELCHVCSVYTGCEVLLCGVCYRVYHQGCLSKIGQWSGPPDLLATAGMWTCHQCSTLGNLLTDQEVTEVLKRLNKCGIRREDDITLRDYLAFCHVSLQEDEEKVLTRDKAENAKRRFAQVDTEGRGRITWCQFLDVEAVRILKKRNKNALVRLLTKPELERARDAFRILDTDMDGRITKATAHDALDRNSRRSGYYPDETMMYIDEDLDQSISWMEFLQDRAIYIIAERPCLRASPLGHSTSRRGSNRSSLAAATSLPVTPITKTPPLQHGKGVARDASRPVATSVPNTPGCKQETGVSPCRHSDGAAQGFKGFPGNMHASAAYGSEQGSAVQQNHSVKAAVKRQSAGFPLLPPPPPSSRAGSSHHAHRASSSVPSTPVKKTSPDFQSPHLSGFISCSNPAYQDQSPHLGSTHSAGSSGSRLSGGSDTGVTPRRLSGQGEQQAGVPGNPFRRESSGSTRGSSQSDSACAPVATGNGGGHVTGKPPTGSGYGRAVAAPPYGKLVEKVQKGEYRHGQARSMLLSSDSAFAQITPTFGHVTSDTNTGRRPLSLV